MSRLEERALEERERIEREQRQKENKLRQAEDNEALVASEKPQP